MSDCFGFFSSMYCVSTDRHYDVISSVCFRLEGTEKTLLTSSGCLLTVLFMTDDSNKQNYTGFRARYEMVSRKCLLDANQFNVSVLSCVYLFYN